MAETESPSRRFACDVHTHTLFSRHAYSTLEENVRAAADQGLELLGIADHFSDMLFPEVDCRNYQYFINMGIWPREWHGVRLLRGAEADIVDLDGHLFGHDIAFDKGIVGQDIAATTLKDWALRACDYVVASIHYSGFADGASLAQTTAMYCRAIEDPKVLIVGHPGRAGVPFDIDEVLACARENHVLIEINEHSLEDRSGRSQEVCRDIAVRCAETGTPIAVSTDAHVSWSIGRFDAVPRMLDEIDFPAELIATRSADAFLDAMAAAGLGLSCSGGLPPRAGNTSTRTAAPSQSEKFSGLGVRS